MITEFNFDNSKSIEIPHGFTVLCDLDGTLVDTDYANYLSYRRALIEITNGINDLNFSNNRVNRESLKKIITSLTETQLNLITSLKSKYFKEYLSYTSLNTDLADFIIRHRRKNPIALVTCSRELRAAEVLNHHKLLKFFTIMICREALLLGRSHNKYKNAISLIGVTPETVLIFEDDNIGIEQALIAGVPSGNIYKICS